MIQSFSTPRPSRSAAWNESADQVAFFLINHETDEHYWSPEMKAIFGLLEGTPGDFEDLWGVAHPADRRAVLEVITRSLHPDGPRRFCIEHRVIRPDGTERRVRTVAHTRFNCDGGKTWPARTVGAVTDITDEMGAGEALAIHFPKAESIAQVEATSIHARS